MRFISSFLATICLAIGAIVFFFPPDGGASTDQSAIARSTPLPQGTFSVETLQITAPANSPNRRDYTAPASIGRPHSFAYETPDGRVQNRDWVAFKPGGFGPFPVVVLLHGSNRSGHAMIDMWQSTAQREGLMLIAPNAHNRSHWILSDDGPDFVSALLAEAEKTYPIDRSNLYLMGHSAGGIFAQILAVENKNDWQYIATHGGSYAFDLSGKTANPTQLGLYTGDQDHLHPPAKTHPTGQALADIGHQVTAYDIADHTHWYYVIGPTLSDHMWREMRQHQR